MIGGSGSLELAYADAVALADNSDLGALMREAGRLRDSGHGNILTYSRKVFVPLTQLCRNSCHYCTFAQPPRGNKQLYMTRDDVTAIVKRAEAAGCTEVLFTLGDKPELRYSRAQAALNELGHETTLDYLHEIAETVLNSSSLLPHLNPGVMSSADMAKLRPVSASMGLMLETASDRLSLPGGVHFGSPDKNPATRLRTIADAGALKIPFTSGLLIGIGETRRERIESLLALRELNQQYGHIQEIIVQPFRAKVGTRMVNNPDASEGDLLWTIAVARLIFGHEMNIQTPPNLSPNAIDQAVAAGINDWGGISPVTSDFVNPEAPWPNVEHLAGRMRAVGRTLVQRLPIYPEFTTDSRWTDPAIRSHIVRLSDSDRLARDSTWSSGGKIAPPSLQARKGGTAHRTSLDGVLSAATAGRELLEEDIARLFRARGDDFLDVCKAADEVRRAQSGDVVRYVVNRNINYTNVCSYRCAFCAFSKGNASAGLRGRAYDLDAEEIARRVREAWSRGATEVCMQGGIHPDYTGNTYLAALRAVKEAVPDMHVHAFSPLEVRQGAQTLGVTVSDFLRRLRDEGLGSLPGTAAEILDDAVRDILCPDKLRTAEWLAVVEEAHRVGLRTTATIMFGHVESPIHWARHLLAIRRLQARTSGFTEFVPLPFVHMEAPIYFKGSARKGPTWREAVLMHAVSRLALHPLIPNIQLSWVKMGTAGAASCLQAGANDLGGTLMNESISRAAGASHGEELRPHAMDAVIRSIGRMPEQRTTLYQNTPPERRRLSYGDMPLTPAVQPSATRKARLGGRQTITAH